MGLLRWHWHLDFEGLAVLGDDRIGSASAISDLERAIFLSAGCGDFQDARHVFHIGITSWIVGQHGWGLDAVCAGCTVAQDRVCAINRERSDGQERSFDDAARRGRRELELPDVVNVGIWFIGDSAGNRDVMVLRDLVTVAARVAFTGSGFGHDFAGQFVCAFFAEVDDGIKTALPSNVRGIADLNGTGPREAVSNAVAGAIEGHGCVVWHFIAVGVHDRRWRDGHAFLGGLAWFEAGVAVAATFASVALNAESSTARGERNAVEAQVVHGVAGGQARGGAGGLITDGGCGTGGKALTGQWCAGFEVRGAAATCEREGEDERGGDQDWLGHLVSFARFLAGLGGLVDVVPHLLD
jgi:hypothetical protein